MRKRKSTTQKMWDEWEELAREERLSRKLAKGKITEEEMEEMLEHGIEDANELRRAKERDDSDEEEERTVPKHDRERQKRETMARFLAQSRKRARASHRKRARHLAKQGK